MSGCKTTGDVPVCPPPEIQIVEVPVIVEVFPEHPIVEPCIISPPPVAGTNADLFGWLAGTIVHLNQCVAERDAALEG